MKYQYTIADYLAAIHREQAKRSTVYPKILTKMVKNGEDISKISGEMRYQNELLILVEYMIEDDVEDVYSGSQKIDALNELVREYKMRKRVYPRWIYLDKNRKRPRITQETADYEMAVWKELSIYFEKKSLGSTRVFMNALEPKRPFNYADPR